MIPAALILAALAAGELPLVAETQPVPKPVVCMDAGTLAAMMMSVSLRHGPGVYLKPMVGKDGTLVIFVQFEGDRTVVGYPFDANGCVKKRG